MTKDRMSFELHGKKYSLGHFKLHSIELDVESRLDFGCPVAILRVTLHCNERDTGKPSVVYNQTTLATLEMPGPEGRVRYPDEYLNKLILRTITDALIHEVEEHFTVDGERVFDPHAESRST